MTKISELTPLVSPSGSEEIPWRLSVDNGSLTVARIRGYSGTIRIITDPGNITVAAGDGLIVLNKTVSQATTVSFPLSATKVGMVEIVDWKGDSDLFPITATLSGSEKFNAAQTTWTIAGPGASAVFRPIPGLGYAI